DSGENGPGREWRGPIRPPPVEPGPPSTNLTWNVDPRPYKSLFLNYTEPSPEPAPPPSPARSPVRARRRRVPGSLVALSSAAILAVYAAGYLRTQPAEDQLTSSDRAPSALAGPAPTAAPPGAAPGRDVQSATPPRTPGFRPGGNAIPGDRGLGRGLPGGSGEPAAPTATPSPASGAPAASA